MRIGISWSMNSEEGNSRIWIPSKELNLDIKEN